MKLKISLLLLLFPFFSLQAQQGHIKRNTTIQGLQIGDKVPDILINQINGLTLNGTPVSSIHLLSDFPSHLIILDFWATWCSPCRAMIPVMDSLQRTFKGRMVFLPVTYESAAIVKPILAEIRKRHPFDLPGITGDTELAKLFPHRSLPHEIWIKDGKVAAITGYEELTAEKIQRMLSAKPQQLRLKKDTVAHYDPAKPLLSGTNGGDGNTLIYRAIFAGYTAGLTSGYTIGVPDSTGRRITARNLSIPVLYALAFGEDKRFIGNNRILLEVKDTAELLNKSHGAAYIDWMKQHHAYCYEITASPQLAKDIYKLMQRDLAQLLPQYNAALETRQVSCWVLRRTSKIDKLKSTGRYPVASIGPYGATLVNQPLGRLTGSLSAIYLQKQLPLINETGYTAAVDLQLNANLSNINELNTALAAYDLHLSREQRPLELLVIRDQPKP
jgi:thiol-disulfide isomerase/thioredoxin